MDVFINYLVYFIGILFLIIFFHAIFADRGRGKMLGGKIVDPVAGEIRRKRGLLSMKIKIYLVERKSRRKHVGIEITQSAGLGWSRRYYTLNKRETILLVDLLNDALRKI